MTFSGVLNSIFRIAEAGALVAITIFAVNATRAINQASQSITAIQKTVDSLPPQVISEVDKQLTGARIDTNKQIDLTRTMLDQHLSVLTGTLYRELDQTREQLLTQTGQLTGSASQLITDADKQTLPAVNTILENKDIPGVIRDTRLTLAFAGQTMRHVDTVSDQIALATPAVAKSATGITDSVDGISRDVRKVTDEMVAPKPWYKKAWALLMDASSFKAFF